MAMSTDALLCIKQRFAIKRIKKRYYDFVDRQCIPVNYHNYERFVNTYADFYNDDENHVSLVIEPFHILKLNEKTSKDMEEVTSLGTRIMDNFDMKIPASQDDINRLIELHKILDANWQSLVWTDDEFATIKSNYCSKFGTNGIVFVVTENTMNKMLITREEEVDVNVSFYDVYTALEVAGRDSYNISKIFDSFKSIYIRKAILINKGAILRKLVSGNGMCYIDETTAKRLSGSPYDADFDETYIEADAVDSSDSDSSSEDESGSEDGSEDGSDGKDSSQSKINDVIYFPLYASMPRGSGNYGSDGMLKYQITEEGPGAKKSDMIKSFNEVLHIKANKIYVVLTEKMMKMYDDNKPLFDTKASVIGNHKITIIVDFNLMYNPLKKYSANHFKLVNDSNIMITSQSDKLPKLKLEKDIVMKYLSYSPENIVEIQDDKHYSYKVVV
ncbi:unnamed protein product [Sphagnum troendelagicum]